MPVGFSSAARNLFLLGSSGGDVVTNFYKTITDSTSDGSFVVDEIKYDYDDDSYTIGGTAQNSNSVKFGWIEERAENGTLDWSTRVIGTSNQNTTLRAFDCNSNYLVAVGKAGDFPWIARYSDVNGNVAWQSSSFSADVEYTGVAIDPLGNSYVAGSSFTSGFIEKYDSTGNPGWGKVADMPGRQVVIKKLDVSSKTGVVGVGFLEDDSRDKGYLIKLNPSTGDVEWDRTISSNAVGAVTFLRVVPNSVHVDSQNFIYVVGTLTDDDTIKRGFIIKYSPEGNMLWQKEVTGGVTEYHDIKVDGVTGQCIVIGREELTNPTVERLTLSKYSKSGELLWRRSATSSFNSSFNLGYSDSTGIALDADPSFYYVVYNDEAFNGLTGDPDRYTYGKISSSGNGLGTFQYDDGTGQTVDYEIVTSTPDVIGKLTDGSVRNDTSDFISYPYNATKLMFDDLATPITNKRRQMDSGGSFQYSGSPAIRPTDFQELNLLGDTGFDTETSFVAGAGRGTLISDTPAVELRGDEYSGSGNWLDQSGSNNATPQNGAVYNSGDFGYFEFPNSNSYLQLSSPVLTTPTSLSVELWVKITDTTVDSILLSNRDSNTDGFEATFDSTSKWTFQMNGVVSTINSATVNQDQWYHVVFHYDGSLVKTFVDGVQIQNLSAGVQTFDVTTASTIGAVSYQTSSVQNSFEIGELRVYNNKALTQAEAETNYNASKTKYEGGGTSTITTDKVKDQSGKGNDGVVNGATHNAAGYWEFATTGSSPKFEGHYIEVDYDTNLIATGFTLDFWFNGIDTRPGQVAQFIATQGFMGGASDNDTAWRIERNNSQAGTIEFNVNNGSGFNQNELISTNFPDGTWHHCVCTFNNGTMTIYKNGVQDVQSTSYSGTATHPAVDHVIRIGSRYDAAPYAYNGSIGEFRIYPRALTAAAVFQNYNATRYKYDGIAPNTSPKIGPGIVYDDLLLNYDFSNGFCIEKSSTVIPGAYEIIVDDATTNGAAFGDKQCVATGYGKVVVGARGEDNGVYTAGGKAYVYNASTGALEVTLTPSDISGNDLNFGNAVAICNCSGRIAVSSAAGLYLYDANGSNEVIINSNTTLPISPPGGNTFGNGLAISGNKVWVADDNVPQGPNYGGTVYCFNAETGAFIYELRPVDKFDNFIRYGARIAANDGVLAIAAESIAHPVTGRQSTGRVYLYDFNGRNEKILEPNDLTTSALFGGLSDVAIGHGMIVVGASRQQRVEDPLTIGSGEVYVFDLEGKFRFSFRPLDDPADEDSDFMGFGESVAISSDRIIVGARNYVGNPGGVAGRAYLFTHTGRQVQGWFGSGGGDASDFGSSVDAEGGVLVIGAGSGSADASGRAYIYPLTGTPSGNIINLSSTSYPGTINGATFNPAGYFEFDNDGTTMTDWIEVPSFTGFPGGNNSYSYSFWMRTNFTDSTDNPEAIVFYGSEATGQAIRIRVNSSGALTVGHWGGPGYDWSTPGGVVSSNTWHHVCETYDGTTNENIIYVDGTQAQTPETTNNLSIPTSATLYLGRRISSGSGAGSGDYNGDIGGLLVYNQTLSATEVSQNYNATKGKYGL